MIQQIKSFVKDSGMSEEYSRIFSYISLVMYKQHGVFDAREWSRKGGQPSVVEHNKYEISFNYVELDHLEISMTMVIGYIIY